MNEALNALAALQKVVPHGVAPQPKREPRVWREGDVIAAEFGATLPERCILCNDSKGCKSHQFVFPDAEATSASGRTIGALLVLLLGPIIGGLGYAAAAMRESNKVKVFFCAAHRRKRSLTIGLPICLFLLSLLTIACTGYLQNTGRYQIPDAALPMACGGALLFGALTVIACLCSRNWGLRLEQAKRSIRIFWAGQRFVQSLPDGPPKP